MRGLFPALVGWLLFGFALGLLTTGAVRLAERLFGVTPAPPEPVSPEVKTRVVILGGGFAGVSTAMNLEKEFRDDPSVAFTLVSETNALLFTPMLAEVAASSLEPTHISTPLRSSLHRTRVVRAQVAGIDLENRRVKLSDREETLPYDHLIPRILMRYVSRGLERFGYCACLFALTAHHLDPSREQESPDREPLNETRCRSIGDIGCLIRRQTASRH
jgi:hypothetical protein